MTVFIEGIHQPKLDVLHVGQLKVRGQQGPLNTTPPLLRSLQRSIRIDSRNGRSAFCRQVVVWAADIGVKSQVERGQVLRRAQRQLAIGEYLLVLNQSHQVIGPYIHVHLSIGKTTTKETRINGVPIQARTVVVEQQAVLHIAFGKQVRLQLGRARQAPLCPRPYINGTLRPFKVIDVGIALLANCTAVTGNQIGRFSTEIDVGGGRGLQEGQLVQHVRDEFTRSRERKVSPHDGVVDRLVPDVDLLGQRTLSQIEEGGTHCHVFAWSIVESRTQQRLGLNVEKAVALQGHADWLTTLQKAIVDDAHTAQIVVHRVVLILNQPGTTRGHRHRTLGNVQCIEHDLRTHLTLILALDAEPVQRRDLLSSRLRRVVKRLEHNGLN